MLGELAVIVLRFLGILMLFGPTAKIGGPHRLNREAHRLNREAHRVNREAHRRNREEEGIRKFYKLVFFKKGFVSSVSAGNGEDSVKMKYFVVFQT